MTSSDALKQPSRAPMLAGAGVVALALVGIAWLAAGGAGAGTTVAPPSSVIAAPPTSVAAADPTPPPTSAVPPGVEAPAIVTVSFGSTPSGAEVRQGDTVLCTTPCMQDLPSGGEQVLVFHREGFFDETAHVTPEEGTPVSVRLRPRRRAPETGASSAIKTEI